LPIRGRGPARPTVNHAVTHALTNDLPGLFPRHDGFAARFCGGVPLWRPLCNRWITEAMVRKNAKMSADFSTYKVTSFEAIGARVQGGQASTLAGAFPEPVVERGGWMAWLGLGLCTLSAVFVILMGWAVVSAVIGAQPHHVVRWVPAPPPTGYAAYCDASGDCPAAIPGNVDAGQHPAPAVELTRSLEIAIAAIDRRINHTLRYSLSDGGWHPGAETTGDCRTYVAVKRRALIELGIPRAALRVAVVLTANREAHAVLVLDTDRGLRVLDSLTDSILSPEQTDYRWLLFEQATGTWAFRFAPHAPGLAG
jgi:predicted transglutaminase-like cysteine proteinase